MTKASLSLMSIDGSGDIWLTRSGPRPRQLMDGHSWRTGPHFLFCLGPLPSPPHLSVVLEDRGCGVQSDPWSPNPSLGVSVGWGPLTLLLHLLSVSCEKHSTHEYLSSRNFRCYTHHLFVIISTMLKNTQTVCNLLSFLCFWLCALGKCKFFATYSGFSINGSVPIVSLSQFVLKHLLLIWHSVSLIKVHSLIWNIVFYKAARTFPFHLECQIFHGWFTVNVASNFVYLFRKSSFPSFLLHITTLNFSS